MQIEIYLFPCVNFILLVADCQKIRVVQYIFVDISWSKFYCPKNCRKYRRNFIYAVKWNVPFTAPILLQLNLLQPLIVKNLCPKFHENLTSVLVANSRPWTEGCGLRICHSVLPHKECQKSVLHEYETNFVCVAYFGIPTWKMYNFLSSFLSWVCDNI